MTAADKRRELMRIGALLGCIERAADHTDEAPAVDIGDAIGGARQLVEGVCTALDSRLQRTVDEFTAYVATLSPKERAETERRMAAEMDRIARKLGLGPRD